MTIDSQLVEGMGLFRPADWLPSEAPSLFHALAVDLVAIVVIVFGVYYRRYRRADLVLSYIALNLGLFCVGLVVVNQTQMGVALGFGLFAILSIIRLRSDEVAHEEVAYYFVALVLGIVNGIVLEDRGLVDLISAVVVLAMIVLDNRFVLPDVRRQVVTLDTVHPHEEALRLDLEARLNARVLHMLVRQTDFVREVTVVDVRVRPLPAGDRAPNARDPQLVAEARSIERLEAL